jgi:PBP1b-binding outer membrane lipoprotein LpoB
MRKTISLLFLIFILCGCSAPAATQAVALNWQVQVISHEVKDTLKTVETVTEYNGTKTDVTHVQSPSQGNVYLIINLAVNKVGSEAITFTCRIWLFRMGPVMPITALATIPSSNSTITNRA